jgi:hypothetical protein
MTYNFDVTQAQLQEAIEKAFSNPVSTSGSYIMYGGRGGNKMFQQAMLDHLNSELKGFEMQFRSESGKLVTITYEKYNSLKQETKDIIDRYRVR